MNEQYLELSCKRSTRFPWVSVDGRIHSALVVGVSVAIDSATVVSRFFDSSSYVHVILFGLIARRIVQRLGTGPTCKMSILRLITADPWRERLVSVSLHAYTIETRVSRMRHIGFSRVCFDYGMMVVRVQTSESKDGLVYCSNVSFLPENQTES